MLSHSRQGVVAYSETEIQAGQDELLVGRHLLIRNAARAPEDSR